MRNSSGGPAALHPCAATAERSRGRRYPEAEHVYRNPFQRDRDRIIHCAAFRRLEFKTQVFAYFESDYVRNRLTHTLEVSQIARGVCRVLGLNEDLAEAIALSHDLGHPPFGHAGEQALDEAAAGAGGFNHNIQGLRIVDRLERRYAEFAGLNLSFEVRESFAKHGSGRCCMPDEFAATGPQATLEAQIVDLVDELTYTSHDIDDGLAHGHLTFADLEPIELWAGPLAEVRSRYGRLEPGIERHETVRRVINRLVTDLIETTAARLQAAGYTDIDAVRRADEPVAAFSAPLAAQLEAMKSFLRANLYRDYRVVQMNEKARRVVRDLFNTFTTNPAQLPPHFAAQIESEGVTRVVVDYISGMTDKYALELHAKLFM